MSGRGRRRALGWVGVALAAAAALFWGASAVGPERTTEPAALPGLALVALAGIAAVVATSGVARRVVGVLLGAAGTVVVLVAAIVVASSTPPAAPLLAFAGGLLLAAAGGFVLVCEPRLARLGARYAASHAQAAQADPDRAAWAALDEGRDPTADPTADPTPDPGPAPTGRGGTDAAVKPDDPGGGRGGGAV